jgi:hypothetical protein
MNEELAMGQVGNSRRKFLASAAAVAGATLVQGRTGFASILVSEQQSHTKAD